MAPPRKKISTKPKGPVKIKRVKEVVFDEDARKEYLTGFSKRKKQRELAVRVKAIDKEREEKNESRRQVRDERKERAATNVRNAKALYGDAEDGLGSNDDGDEEEEDEEEAATVDDQDPSTRKPRRTPLHSTSAYESIDLVTTVSIEPFSLSRSSSPGPLNADDDDAIPLPRDADGNIIYPESSKASSRPSGSVTAKKRVKNKAAYRPKMSRADKKDRSTAGKKKKAGFLK